MLHYFYLTNSRLKTQTFNPSARAGRKAENKGNNEVTIQEIKDAAKEARKFR